MKKTASQTRFSVSSQSDQVLRLGEREYWSCRILGYSAVPTKPYRSGKWLVTPAHLDSSPIPERAMERIRRIYANGIRPTGLVLIHEAPLLLASGTGEQAHAENERLEISKTLPLQKPLKMLSGALGILALATGAFALAIVALVVLLPALLTTGVIVLDPILVAVMEDEAWIEIDRWDLEQ